MILNRRKISLLVTLLVSLFLSVNSVEAAAINFYANKTTAYVGDTIVVTVKTNDALGTYSISSSNAGVLSPNGKTSGDFPSLGGSDTYQFKANSIGSVTVTLNPTNMALYSTEQAYTTRSSITINIKAKPVIVLSGDNSLSSLGVEGKELSPTFNRDTLEYSVELEPETTSINVLATPSHGGASISGSGVREVVDGTNRLELVVTAENGTSRTYVINASVKEYNPIEQIVDGKKYTVVRKKSLLNAPENYNETTIKIGDEEVPAFTSEVTKYTLVGLKNESGNINLYVYKDGKYMPYTEYTFNKVILYPMELKESDIPAGYEKTDITYNDQKIIAYKTSELSNYSLLYGMNIETGETNIYMYDEVEDTLQIYNDEEIILLNEKIETLKIVVAVLAGICSFLFLLCIILGSRKNKSKEKKGLDSIDDIQVTQLVGTQLSKREEKRLLKEEQQRKKEEDKRFREEEKKRLKEDARRLKEELKQEKKNKKGKKKDKEDSIDIRNL